MLVFLNGTDSYLAKKAINEIKAKYLEKNSGAELIELEGADGLKNLADLQAVPLFATSRLAIIRRTADLTKDRQKDLAAFLGNLPKTTVAVVWDGGEVIPELQQILDSAPKKIAVKPIEGSMLKAYLKKYAIKLDFTIENELAEGLVSTFGSDLWALTGEIDRLSLGGSKTELKKNQETEKFIYFRLVRNRSWDQVGRQLKKDLDDGVPIELTTGMLASAIRKDLTNKEEKMRLTDLLVDLDYGLKTGWLDAEAVTALLVAHLPKTNEKRVVWERAWQKRGY